MACIEILHVRIRFPMCINPSGVVWSLDNFKNGLNILLFFWKSVIFLASDLYHVSQVSQNHFEVRTLLCLPRSFHILTGWTFSWSVWGAVNIFPCLLFDRSNHPSPTIFRIHNNDIFIIELLLSFSNLFLTLDRKHYPYFCLHLWNNLEIHELLHLLDHLYWLGCIWL